MNMLLVLFWFSPRLFVPLATPKIGCIENKNKCRFILYFARFALPLTSSKVLSLEKIQIKFGFLLAYSYLCNANQQSA